MIIVLADDFSGAAEVAGTAWELGRSAEVHIDHLAALQCDVTVLDLHSRSMTEDQAAEVHREAALSAVEAEPRWIYRKIDSVLRGAVAVEIESICHSLGIVDAVVINANPRKGRTVDQDRIWIDGVPLDQTLFANDPEYPATSSHVIDLLKPRTSTVHFLRDAGHLQSINAGRNQSSEKPSSVKLWFGNCRTTEEMDRYAQLLPPNVLVAGGAEFFESLLTARELGKRTRERSSLQLVPGTLLIRGTSVPSNPSTSRHGLEKMRRIGVQAEQRTEVEQAIALLSVHQSVLLEIEKAGNDLPEEGSLRSEHFENLLRSAIAILQSNQVRQLWIEGGRTASSLIRALGWRQLQVLKNHADGIVELSPAGAPEMVVVVKPGSYPWPIDIDRSRTS